MKQSSSAGDVDDELSSMRGTHDHDPSTSNIRMPHRSDDSKGDLKDDKKPLAKQIKKTKVLSSIRRASPVLSDDVSGKASGIRSISPKPDQKELKLDNFFGNILSYIRICKAYRICRPITYKSQWSLSRTRLKIRLKP